MQVMGVCVNKDIIIFSTHKCTLYIAQETNLDTDMYVHVVCACAITVVLKCEDSMYPRYGVSIFAQIKSLKTV